MKRPGRISPACVAQLELPNIFTAYLIADSSRAGTGTSPASRGNCIWAELSNHSSQAAAGRNVPARQNPLFGDVEGGVTAVTQIIDGRRREYMGRDAVAFEDNTVGP